MKYSDQQRIVKIYEYASKLNVYIKEHHGVYKGTSRYLGMS